MFQDLPTDLILTFFSYLPDLDKIKFFISLDKLNYDEICKRPKCIMVNSFYDVSSKNNFVFSNNINVRNISDLEYLYSNKTNIEKINIYISELDFYDSLDSSIHSKFPKLKLIEHFNKQILLIDSTMINDFLVGNCDDKYKNLTCLNISSCCEKIGDIISNKQKLNLPNSIEHLILTHMESFFIAGIYSYVYPESLTKLELYGYDVLLSICSQHNIPRTVKKLKLVGSEKGGRWCCMRISWIWYITINNIPDSVELLIIGENFESDTQNLITNYPKNLKKLVIPKDAEKYFKNIPGTVVLHFN